MDNVQNCDNFITSILYLRTGLEAVLISSDFKA
jgi:hypothetical protein